MKHHIRSKVAFKRCLRRFPSSSQIIQCLSKETPPCDNNGSLMKTNTERMSLTRKYCQPRETLSFPLHKLFTKALNTPMFASIKRVPITEYGTSLK